MLTIRTSGFPAESKSKVMLWYKLKKQLLWPYVAMQRRRRKSDDRHDSSMFEIFNYSPSIFRFLGDAHVKQLLHKHDLNEQSVVLDVGGFRGAWATEIHNRYASKILVFEPNPKPMIALHKHFDTFDNISLHNYGLSNEDENIPLLVQGPGSSVFEASKSSRSDKAAVEVHLRDVDDVFRELGLTHVDMLKINIEGGEFPLLYRMLERDLISRCDQLLIQFHEWYPWAHWHRWRISRALKKTHRRVWSYAFIWEKWQRR